LSSEKGVRKAGKVVPVLKPGGDYSEKRKRCTGQGHSTVGGGKKISIETEGKEAHS